MGWQWHHLDHMQLAPDRKPRQHLTTQFLRAGCLSGRPTNSVKYHYLVCGCIVFHCGRTDERMYGRTILLGSLSHLSGDDLMMWVPG